MSTSNRAGLPKLSRRQSLQLGTASAAAGLLTTNVAVKPALAKDPPPGPSTPAFMTDLPVYQAKEPAGWTPYSLNPAPTVGPNTSGGECGRAPHQRETELPSQKYYEMRVKEAYHQFHPNLPTQKIWGYDGMLPGPTFVERYGVPITVRIINDLPANAFGFGSPEITTHLHNLHTGSESDGFTGDYYSATKSGPTLGVPGAYKDHHYPNVYAGYDDPQYMVNGVKRGDPREALGTLWYHDHRVDFTAPNVYRGLTGFYLLFDDIDSGNENDPNRNHPDPTKRALCLPSGVGKYDIPLVFQDKQFDSSGYLYFDQFAIKGNLGNKFCVNGKIQPKFKVEGRKYRFRLLDGGPSRLYEFYLTDASGNNLPFTYIGNDGNLLPAPLLNTKKVLLGVAERADIVIDFSQYAGRTLYLVNRLIQTDGRGPEGPLVNTRGADGLLTTAGTQILRFDVGAATYDPSQVPAKLRELPPINLAEVVRTRRFEFDKENEVWTVNGKIFDVDNPVAKPKRGTAEIWTLKGKGSWHHPVHIHFEEGRILSRNGKPPAPHEAGRKDVYLLAPDDEVRVFIRFRDFLGKYMMHCHNLTHEDHAMMIRWDIVE